ncbi:hypothetical protein CANINC_002595 [Pichia inconspicua]|uniref:BZIP domain-containing protein n=1 Tax=Pichia inconspicua TaxID=52247 RepID=A0A4T0X240_9ASCO|nr:hypothetical protein CANINC_002595 [[Candida] inconspicua]
MNYTRYDYDLMKNTGIPNTYNTTPELDIEVDDIHKEMNDNILGNPVININGLNTNNEPNEMLQFMSHPLYNGANGNPVDYNTLAVNEISPPITGSSPQYTTGNQYTSRSVSASKNVSSSSKSSEKNENGSRNGANGPSEEELYQRRKAQNRAAQRAFRERKEGKLKELSGKLANAESAREKLEKQLEELKKKNMMLDLENKILQKKKEGQPTDCMDELLLKNAEAATSILSFKFPSAGKWDFINGTVDWKVHGGVDQTDIEANKLGYSYENEEGEKVLTVSAVWDYLVEFSKLNDNVVLNIPEIMAELRGKEKCHGFGPAYPLRLVNQIVVQHIEDNDD